MRSGSHRTVGRFKNFTILPAFRRATNFQQSVVMRKQLVNYAETCSCRVDEAFPVTDTRHWL